MPKPNISPNKTDVFFKNDSWFVEKLGNRQTKKL